MVRCSGLTMPPGECWGSSMAVSMKFIKRMFVTVVPLLHAHCMAALDRPVRCSDLGSLSTIIALGPQPWLCIMRCACCRANTTGGKPVTGSNVTIPFGWQLVIDESPPPLNLLLIEGAVSFSNTSSIILTATYIVVQNTGVLSAGSAGKPHPAAATILLSGTRNTPQLAITSSLVLGSKVRVGPGRPSVEVMCCSLFVVCHSAAANVLSACSAIKQTVLSVIWSEQRYCCPAMLCCHRFLQQCLAGAWPCMVCLSSSAGPAWQPLWLPVTASSLLWATQLS